MHRQHTHYCSTHARASDTLQEHKQPRQPLLSSHCCDTVTTRASKTLLNNKDTRWDCATRTKAAAQVPRQSEGVQSTPRAVIWDTAPSAHLLLSLLQLLSQAASKLQTTQLHRPHVRLQRLEQLGCNSTMHHRGHAHAKCFSVHLTERRRLLAQCLHRAVGKAAASKRHNSLTRWQQLQP